MKSNGLPKFSKMVGLSTLMYSTVSFASFSYAEELKTPHVSSGRTILFAYDDSYGSEFAVKWAILNFIKPQDFVLLVNVLMETPIDPINLTFDSQRQNDIELKSAESTMVLGKRYQELLSKNDIKTEILVPKGDASSEILSISKKRKAECILMGTRGQGAFGRMFSGSVSKSVMQNAECPVIVVRPHKIE